MCCPLVFEFSVGIGGFVIGLGQISVFFSFIILWVFILQFVQYTRVCSFCECFILIRRAARLSCKHFVQGYVRERLKSFLW